MRTKVLLTSALALCLVLSAAACVYASDYSFKGTPETEYYPSTSYEVTYGSKYNYGGPNKVDYETPALAYGKTATAQDGIQEKAVHPEGRIMSFDDPYSIERYGQGYRISSTNRGVSFTNVLDVIDTKGIMGTVSIPRLNISMKLRDGTSNENMLKGFAHYPLSSAWNGNVCICGHNRGCKTAIGEIKDLKPGDVIIYETVLGTRYYAVDFVKTIANDDWSLLGNTKSNVMTITTCLADHPETRILVRASALN